MIEVLARDTSWTPPSTADYLAFHASHRPEATAVLENGVEYSYARFHRDLRKVTHALAAFGLERGSLVAVACGSVYIHWLLLLGWENLGIATASFIKGESSTTLLALLARADLVMSEADLPAGSKARHHRLTQTWVDAVLASPPPPVNQSTGQGVSLAEVLRIRRSSGTTGGQKMMAVKRREEEACLQQIQQIYGFNQHTRILLVKGFGVAAMYGAATVCVRMGAVSIYETRFDTARAIVEHRANHARLYQFEMLPLLDRFVTDLNKPTEFTAIMGAAPLGDALRARVLSLLASALIYSYSANEVWVISDVDSTGVGTVYPGVQVAVVDESDAPVPAGKSGRVRVRSPAMVEGYLDNPEATARSFRDGWFYTGDAGIMVGPRRLKIVNAGTKGASVAE